MSVDDTSEVFTNVDQMPGSTDDQPTNDTSTIPSAGTMQNEQSTSIAANVSLEPTSIVHKRRRSPRQRKKVTDSLDHSKSPRKCDSSSTTQRISRRQKNQRIQRHTSDPDTDSSCDLVLSVEQRRDRRHVKGTSITSIPYVEEFNEDSNDNEDGNTYNGNRARNGDDIDDDDEEEEYDEDDYDDDDEEDDDDDEEVGEIDEYFDETLAPRSKLSVSTVADTGDLRGDKRSSKRKSKMRQFSTQRRPSNETYEAKSGRIISKSQMRGMYKFRLVFF